MLLSLNSYKKIQILIYLTCLLLHSSVVAAEKREVAIIVSSHIKPFVLALEGFRANISQPTSIQYVDSNPELVKHKLANNKFKLIVAIGPAAAQVVWASAARDTPKMVLMVLDPNELIASSESLCGIHLRVPAAKQLRLIKQRLGPGRNVGVIYNPLENDQWIINATNAAQDAGVNLIPLQVSKKKDIPIIFSSAVKQINTLLFIPDSTVISETTVRYIIKQSLLSKVAVAGYNNFFLDTGAVMSFAINYHEVGVSGAQLAKDVLTGMRCKLTPPPFEVKWNSKAWDFINQ